MISKSLNPSVNPFLPLSPHKNLYSLLNLVTGLQSPKTLIILPWVLGNRITLLKAGNRLNDYPLIVANRKEDFVDGEQVAWIITSKKEAIRVQGKEEIAKAIINSLELIIKEG